MNVPFDFSHFFLWQDVKLDNLETNHFVLVHGGGFGAWCWYNTIALLEEGGFKATAVDLTGSGIHSFDTNGITSLLQYVKPLTDFLEKLSKGEKVLFYFFLCIHFCNYAPCSLFSLFLGQKWLFVMEIKFEACELIQDTSCSIPNLNLGRF